MGGKAKMKDKTKRLILVSILVLGFFIMLIGNAKAEDLVKEPITKLTTYDSIKSYDTKTQTLTLINKTDLSKNVATLKLNTPIHNLIGLGYQKVAEFTINNNLENVEAPLKNIEFYNRINYLKYGEEAQKISLDYDYKLLTYKEIDINNYEDVCIFGKNNITTCEEKLIGTHKQKVEEWINYDFSYIPKGTYTIGIFTEVKEGDKIEWIPEYYETKIKEWAWWESLPFYYDNFNVPTSSWTADVQGKGVYSGFNAKANMDFYVINLTHRFDLLDKCIITYFNGTNIGNSTSFDNYIATWNPPVKINNNSNFTITCGNDTANFNMAFKAFNHPWGNTTFMNTTNRINYNGVPDGTPDLVQAGYSVGIYGIGILYGTPLLPPEVTLNSPINYYNSSNQAINFNTSVTSTSGIQNVSLYIDGILNETNTSGINGTYLFTKILSEDNHNWSILAFDNITQSTQSSTRYFTIDSTPPVINVTMPPTNNYKFWTNYTDGIRDYFPYSSYFINWTTYDLSLNTCWFENISSLNFMIRVNETVTCNANATIVYPVRTINTLRFFANDSMGNNASVTRTSIYNDIRIDRSGHSYINYTTEGVPRTFWLSAIIGVGAELENVNFVFDGVKYPLSTSGSNFSKTIIIPEVTTTKATTYYWEFDFGEGFFNSTIYNITIGNILLSPICNSTYPYYIFNVTLRDEKTQREINGTIETAISIYPLANSSINIYNWNSTQNINRTYLCSNLPFNSTDIYKAEGTIKYYSDLGTITNYTAMNEYYSFLNFTLNNNSQFNNITLYDINTSEGTEFQLTFKDSSYRDRENVLIYVYRQYLPENTFKIVEVPKTDSNGQTIVHLVRNDVIYNLIAVDSTGSILGILNNVNAFCNDYTIGDCKIEFQGTTSETELENYIDDLGFSYTLTFNETSSTINLEFLSDTNEDKNIRLVVISSAIVTNRTLCNTSLDTITGTLSCDVSSIINSSSSINVKIYLDEQEVINDYLSLDSSDWNVSGIIFFGFLFIILIGIMFIESKEGMIIGVIVGLIILVALGVVKGKVIGFTSGILWLIVAGIIILIKLNKENK